MNQRSVLVPAALAALCLAAGSAAHAQSARAGNYSLLPYTTQGYVGLNVGKPDYKLGCAAGYSCDQPSARAHLYTGGLLNPWAGVELGYMNEGKFDRAGGSTKAQGVNLALVLRAPVDAFNFYGKLGTVYGRTRVSADALSGVPTGKDSGWGASYALGAGYDFQPNVGVVLEWSRNEYRFVGQGRENVDATSLGLVYRF